MNADQVAMDDPRVETALDELREIIRGRFPEAKFAVRTGDDPLGMYLVATVDTDDITEVVDLVSDRLVTMQVDDRLPVFVAPVHTRQRVATRLRAQQQQRAARQPATAARRS